MDDLLYLRRHMNTSHFCICVGSDLTPATVARTSSASHLRHSPAVFRHASMLVLSAQFSHVELALFVPLRTGSVTVSTPGCASIASSSQHATATGSGVSEGESHELSLLTKTSDDPPPLSSSQQSDGFVALPRTGPHSQDFLNVPTCVAMRLLSTLRSMASRRISG